MADAGETSFTLSRFNGDLSFADIDVDRRTIQGSIALDGSFDDGRWRHGLYYSHGEYRNKLRTPGFLHNQIVANAVDSLIEPGPGDATCRIAIPIPATNSVPTHLSGPGPHTHAS